MVGKRRDQQFANLEYLALDAGHEADIDSLASSR